MRLTQEQLESMSEDEFRAHLKARALNCKGRGIDCGPCEGCHKPQGMSQKDWIKEWPCGHVCEARGKHYGRAIKQ